MRRQHITIGHGPGKPATVLTCKSFEMRIGGELFMSQGHCDRNELIERARNIRANRYRDLWITLQEADAIERTCFADLAKIAQLRRRALGYRYTVETWDGFITWATGLPTSRPYEKDVQDRYCRMMSGDPFGDLGDPADFALYVATHEKARGRRDAAEISAAWDWDRKRRRLHAGQEIDRGELLYAFRQLPDRERLDWLWISGEYGGHPPIERDSPCTCDPATNVRAPCWDNGSDVWRCAGCHSTWSCLENDAAEDRRARPRAPRPHPPYLPGGRLSPSVKVVV